MDEDRLLAVKKGAHLLDVLYPNWASSINLDKFEMNDCHRCIVGQAIGDYGAAISLLSGQEPYSPESSEWSFQYGFEVSVEDYERNGSQGYRDLEILWTEQVKNRLG